MICFFLFKRLRNIFPRDSTERSKRTLDLLSLHPSSNNFLYHLIIRNTQRFSLRASEADWLRHSVQINFSSHFFLSVNWINSTRIVTRRRRRNIKLFQNTEAVISENLFPHPCRDDWCRANISLVPSISNIYLRRITKASLRQFINQIYLALLFDLLVGANDRG